MRRDLLRRLVAGALVLAVLGGAGFGVYTVVGRAGPPSITVHAVFPDVEQLDTGAPVQLADITIGQVDSITLDGSQAMVTMSVERSADVPADVSAQIRQATILGQEVVELVPESGAPSNVLLADGTTIHNATVVPGVEQLVQAGTAVIGSIGTSDLADLVQAGAQGFGGQGPTLRRLLSDLDTVSTAYASRDAEITSLIGDLDQLGTSLAPSAGSNAAALANLARATGVLASQSDRLDQLLGALDRVAVAGRSILESYLPQIDLQLLGLDRVTAALAARQTDLGMLLEQLPGHDAVLAGVTQGGFAQVVNDLIVCGLPGGGESSQASQTCAASGGSKK
jgi:phospholipid/cholesterol/gamma-HCH transport system substrate-binding protein